MSTLYRDYRPQKFSEVLGQNYIKIALQNEIAAGRPASAYLFCGPRAVGKTTLARVLARAVNCTRRSEGEYEPCNECESCHSIAEGENLDIIEIDAASNTGVDNVRENIIAFSRIAPTNAKYKVFIIDEVHMMSVSAFNALLKIIEEPPHYVIFILCTTEIQKVPSTIISRCERYDFRRINLEEIVRKLSYIAKQEKVEVEKSVLEAVARRSGGHLRDAESLLGQIFSLGDKKISREQAELVIPHYNSDEAISLLDYLSRKDAAKAIKLVNTLVDSGVNMRVFSNEIISFLRRIMLDKLNPELANNLGLDLGEDLEKRLLSIVDNLTWEQIFLATRLFLNLVADKQSYSITQLPLELAIGEFCFAPNKQIIDSSRMSSSGPSSKWLSGINNKGGVDSIQTKKANITGSSDLNDRKIISSNINLSLSDIEEKWPEFLVKIKKHNHSLSFVLQNCRPQDIKEGKLFLVFKYKFHQDRINNPEIKSIVEKTLAEVFGTNLTLDSILDDNLDLNQHLNKKSEEESLKSKSNIEQTVKEDKKNLVSDLLHTFGGEIIN